MALDFSHMFHLYSRQSLLLWALVPLLILRDKPVLLHWWWFRAGTPLVWVLGGFPEYQMYQVSVL